MRFVYPARLHRTGSDEIVVSFRDLPDCLTSGGNESEALTEAADALEEAIAGRIIDGNPIPPPSARRAGEHRVAVPPAMATKAALVLVFRDSGLSRVAFAGQLGIDDKVVRRMLDPRHATAANRTRQITRITRQDIVDAIQEENIVWSGRLSEVEFLNRIFDLDKLPSDDPRCPHAEGDIYLHRETFRDWDDDWVFDDDRFDLMGCDDEMFLVFLCQTVHPEVRSNVGDIEKVVAVYNKHLANDGFQLVEESWLSGRPVYTGRFAGLITTAAIANARNALAGADNGYISQQLSRMEKAVTRDPDLAIGTAKEFVETCCNTILEDRGVSISGKSDIPQLTKLTSKELRLTSEDVPDKAKAVDKIRRVLSNLASITQGLAELRNSYGTGHGRSVRRRGLNSRHAKLAVGAATTLGVFLVETHKEQMSETSEKNTAQAGDA